jgi:hypothetical protein
MKGNIFVFVPACILSLALTACGKPLIPGAYPVILPEIPSAWEEMLGPPHWHLEWIDPAGRPRRFEGPPADFPALDILQEWANPVLAYPYWPEREIPPGLMRPAGALFPLDVEGSALRLSWEAAPDAWFYQALQAAYGAAAAVEAEAAEAAAAVEAEAVEAAAAEAAAVGAAARGTSRRPEYFDWSRFRELRQGPDIPPEIREDPWLADWKAIAVQTVQSGFDRRRIRLPEQEDLWERHPGEGPWIGNSPFAAARPWASGERVNLEAVAGIRAYLSPGGILRYSRDAWIWISFPGP